ncbi:DUF3822 family protein [Prevotella sp. E13-17]|uniref:DUF3822 family protein n=1 Tax=Prevotella sp. E13-17 TaxID=2913616 RepID=UPI001EDAE1AB|nr:DUF3822 family protein [Prevotella sp. E13-17]UKK51739.1 DUF3822 family protein [Prevotella sp. E13-17]
MVENKNSKHVITMRIGRNTLSFSKHLEDDSVVNEPFIVKSGVSMAANLREAFKSSELLAESQDKVRVLIDTDVLMVPIELFEEATKDDMFYQAFPSRTQELVYFNVLPDLNAVAVFSMNRDLRLVIDDHFSDVTLLVAMLPVWRQLHQRSYTGPRHKLYGYFHEKRLDVFSFQQNRFKFCNVFDASHQNGSLYFLLYVWKQLQLASETDELHLCGNVPEADKLVVELKKYVKNVYLDEDNNR